MTKNTSPFSVRTVATAVIVLLAAAHETRAAVVARDFESVNFGRLATLADELRAIVARSAADGGATEVRARFRTSAAQDPRAAAGCGFAFLANDDAGLSAHLPRYERAACGGPHRYRVQFVRPDAVYEESVTVKVPVHNVTVTSNGGDGLDLDTLCLGFRGGSGGVQAFCVDRRLLDACVLHGELRGGNAFLGTGIRLSRAFAGHMAPNCKEIGFRDVGSLARGFESLKRDATDGGAQAAVCSRIALLAESSAWAIDAAKCYAEKEDATADGGKFNHVKIRADYLRDNCTHVRRPGDLFDVDDDA